MFGIHAAALHARDEVGIIQESTANFANTIENLLLLERTMKSEPFFKQRCDAVRKTKWNVARRHSTCFRGSCDDRWHLVIGQPRNYRRDQSTHWNAGHSQRLDGCQPPRRLR